MAPLENIDDILQRSYPYSSVKYLDELRENFLQTEIKNLSQLPHQTENQLEKIQSLQHEIQKLPTQNIHNVSSYEKESNLFFDFKTQTWYSYDKKIKN
ncbi:hypothetical protein IJM86_08520 [bacterium]|nr:hypothetical protein [bacterium]